MKKTVYRLMGWALLAFLIANIVPSCGKEPVICLDDDDFALVITPSLMDIQNGRLTTKAAIDTYTDDSKFNENRVKRLDVFFFDAENNDSFVTAYHPEELTVVTYHNRDGYLLTHNWTNDLEKNHNYHVYVIANSNNEKINSAKTVTIAELQAEVRSEGEIYKRQGVIVDGDQGVSSHTYTEDKSFLMNALVNWKITSAGTQFINDTQDVTLTRAAVKFVVDVSLTKEFLQRLVDEGNKYGTPSWKYINFNTVTAEVPGGTAPTAVLANAPSSYYLKVETETGSDSKTHYTVVTYAYPQTWAAVSYDNPASWDKYIQAPAIMLSFPCTHGEEDLSKAAYHYYYIPLTSGLTATQSNHVYKVNALISSYGSTEPITNEDIELKYEVQEWTAVSDQIEAKVEDYLIVTPTHYVFKGGPENDYLTTTLKYYASGPVSILTNAQGQKVFDAFFIDLSGEHQDLAEGQYIVADPANGVIEIRSKVPTNGTYQQVEFDVILGTRTDIKKQEHIAFRHYPLDFVVQQAGSYSSYEHSRWAQADPQRSGYNQSYISRGYFIFTTDYNNGAFNAKILNANGTLHYLSGSGTDGGAIPNIGKNNKSYILQVTSTSDSFTLGRPRLTSQRATVYDDQSRSYNIYYDYSEDDVIAPAFMIASQLGASSSSSYGFQNATQAAIHCSLYKEVINGTPYSDWRLPTRQEVEYMIKEQYDHDQVMAEVLGGYRYYTLDGEYATNTHVPVGNYTFTRCVREVSEEELEKINVFE